MMELLMVLAGCTFVVTLIVLLMVAVDHRRQGQQLDRLRLDLAVVRGHLDRQRQEQDDVESKIGQTWIPDNTDQRSLEQILHKQASARAHARTGSDPFSSSAKLAP